MIEKYIFLLCSTNNFVEYCIKCDYCCVFIDRSHFLKPKILINHEQIEILNLNKR